MREHKAQELVIEPDPIHELQHGDAEDDGRTRRGAVKKPINAGAAFGRYRTRP